MRKGSWKKKVIIIISKHRRLTQLHKHTQLKRNTHTNLLGMRVAKRNRHKHKHTYRHRQGTSREEEEEETNLRLGNIDSRICTDAAGPVKSHSATLNRIAFRDVGDECVSLSCIFIAEDLPVLFCSHQQPSILS